MRELAIKLRLAGAGLVAAGVLAAAPASAHAQFGIASFSTTTSMSQAGAHADFSAGFAMNTEALGNPEGQLRDVTVALPPGVIGDPQAIERCSAKAFSTLKCSPGSQVGVMNTSFVVCPGVTSPLEVEAEAGASTINVVNATRFCATEQGGGNTITIGTGATADTVKIAYVNDSHTITLAEPLAHLHSLGEPVTHINQPVVAPIPLFNLQPSAGHVATFGASLLVANIMVQVDVHPGSYGLTATISGISTLLGVQAATLTLWGVPADPSHDSQRCNQFLFGCGPAGVPAEPFMTNPTDCSGPPLTSTATIDSYEGQEATSQTTLAPPTGCDKLSIAPTLNVVPGTTQADTPSAYDVEVTNPQETEPYATATPDLQSVSVTLPKGTSLSPPVANGLHACTLTQFENSSSGCPNASKVGTAEVTTPLLPDHLTGAVYIGAPTASERYPIFVRVSADNVTVNFTGQAEPDNGSGQVTAAFHDVPQLPFSAFKLSIGGGPGAALANPATCGPATSTAQVTSYTGQTASPTSQFSVDSNGEGGACPATAPFAPTFSAGVSSPLAGGFSPFTLDIARTDGEQRLGAIEAQLPPGLIGLLKTVSLCGEAEASAHSCSPASQIGTATVAAGAGPLPLYISGPLYLTGPYAGAPYGLSIVMNAIAGPFNLGVIAVRAAIHIDPSDAHLTIVSDAFPQILSGIPLRLRGLNATINRAGFILNPTSCVAQHATGTVTSAEGATAAVSTTLQVGGCPGLSFTPKLRASTSGHPSRAGGTSLELKVTYPAGTHANIRSVAVSLPRQLRSRLTTVQQACRAAVLAANPSTCPAASRIGIGQVSTPVLAAPLSGPVYLVAAGGIFPHLAMLLHSEGVAINLNGTVNISKGGITTTAFNALPDVPITAFTINLPSGPHSVLGAATPLCRKPPTITDVITAQSGAQTKQATKAIVTGCARAHKPKRARFRRHTRR